MMFAKHPYLFCGAFNESPMYYLFFSESGEFDDGFVYPIKAQIVPMKFENDSDVRVDAKRKLQLLTFIANINIILSYRYNKWFEFDANNIDANKIIYLYSNKHKKWIEDDIETVFRKAQRTTRYKIFWNRDNIEILEDLGEDAEAIDRLFAKKGEILKRLKISQEEYDRYFPLAREYIMYLRNRIIEDTTSCEHFYDLEMGRYIASFYIYNENGHPLIDRCVYLSKYPHFLDLFFQEGVYYPSYLEWAEPSRELGIPEILIIEKYIEYANKYTPPEYERFKMIAIAEMREWGLI